MVEINDKTLSCKIYLLISLMLIICFGKFIAIAQNQQPPAEEKKADKAPVLFGVVADNSGSMRSILENVIVTTRKIAEAKKPEDEMFLARFVNSDKIQILVPPTTDKSAIIREADNFFIEYGASAITDALYLSADSLSKSKSCAAASCNLSLILISDGKERESRYKTEQLLKLLKENSIRIFTIRLIEQLENNNSDDIKDKQVTFLKKLSAQAGGKAYFPKTIEEIDANIKEIIQSFRR